jgi:uncharacterized RDD family membrane protein YckC
MTSIRYCPRCGKEIKREGSKTLPKECDNCGLNFDEREDQIQELDSQKDHKSVVYADLFQRVAAFFIDSLVISFLTWIAISLIHIPFIISGPIAFYSSFYYFWIAMFFNWVLGFFYCCLLEIYNKGQTLGKRVLHLQTLDEKTLKVATPEQYAITNILKTSPFLLIDFIVGFLISERESNKILRYLQYLSKTVVIDLKH